jgi:DNA repair protein SbcC/Rad50
MLLRSLALRNFRQHADTRIDFRRGLTGIIGPNGAGKTTILEAIAWAIYGSQAARGTNDTIRFSRAAGRSRVEAELVFELGAHEFRVCRSLASAEVYLDGGASPVASGLGAATDYLARRLGMSRVEFFNTYFTGQKELQFLAQLGAADRARFLGQVLGYERLRLVQERVRVHRSELRQRGEGLRAGLPDPQLVRRELDDAVARHGQAADRVAAATAALEGAALAVAELTPAWESAQQGRDRDRELAHGLELAARERDAALREMARLDAELARVAQAADERAALASPLAGLAPLAEECDRLAALAESTARRRALEEAEARGRAELEQLTNRLERLQQAPGALARFTTELDDARQALRSAEEAAARAAAEWVQAKQECETRLTHYRERAAELKEQLRQLRGAGPDGTCPTCTRPLREEFDRVVGALHDEWERLVQDGKWLAQRLEQLTVKPDDLLAAEAGRDAARRDAEERAHRHAQTERAVQELWTLAEDVSARRAGLASLAQELVALPAGYDADAHRAARARLDELHALERHAAALDQALAAGDRLAAERAARATAADAAAARAASLQVERTELAHSEPRFHEARQRHEGAIAARQRAEIETTGARERLAAADQALSAARRAEESFRARLAELQRLELELRHHAELDQALTRLRSQLNARVRPELSELASAFLADITDGRYTALELDDGYDLLVLDEGEEKPVISGGEEDIANLVLRLAISQMIAERAGQPLSVLILDEVFASLDLERRDSVIQLLHKLSDRFEQVILITHVETIREGLDQVLRVSYDERSGASLVREELTAPAPELAPA